MNISPDCFGLNCGRVSDFLTTPTTSIVPLIWPSSLLFGLTKFFGTHPRLINTILLKRRIYWLFTMCADVKNGLSFSHFVFSIWNGVMTKYPIDESCCVNRPPFCSSFGVINDLGPMISSRSWRNSPRTRTGLYSMESKSDKLKTEKTIKAFTSCTFSQLLIWQIYR